MNDTGWQALPRSAACSSWRFSHARARQDLAFARAAAAEQGEACDFLGLTIETVSHTFAKLRILGLGFGDPRSTDAAATG